MYGYADSPQIGQLSRYVRKWESAPGDPAAEVNLWEREVDAEPHPLVLELAADDKDGVSAALAYLAEGSTSDAPALIRWMMAGAFKGHFESNASFCKDQFADKIADHMEDWTGSQEIGFPLGVDWGEAIDWEDIAYKAVAGPWACEDEQVFYSIDVDSGVYVFDMSIPFSDYENDEE